MNKNFTISVERVVADHLENKLMTLRDALEELNLDVNLAEDKVFCTALDHHVFCCVDCGYWYLNCLMMEDHKGEEICEECANCN